MWQNRLTSSRLESDPILVEAFYEYLDKRKIEAKIGRRFFVKGLCFLQIDALVEQAEEIATFTAVRALRQMPKLRTLHPALRSTAIPSTVPELPEGPPVSDNLRVAIFDAGLPDSHPLTKWATPHEFPKMEAATDAFLSHGVAVTSAALFGHIDPKKPLQRPYSPIDHYRIVDTAPNQDLDELYEVLERIEEILESQEYDFINLSIGPELPIDDNDVHSWTAVLDERLTRISTLAMIAVGNGGEGDAISRLNRVQVPSDCVNALAIGACNTPDEGWERTTYSSIGPGRSPGRVKPDFVDFGGDVGRPFVVLTRDLPPKLAGLAGTSLACPNAMRLATGVRAHFGQSLNHLAIRALLIHTCEIGESGPNEVGWGRIARSLDDIVLCNNDTERIVYQGEISPAKYIRAQIPVPSGELQGKVSIKATICYKSETDPHHPGNYTRAGIDVIFRPHDRRFKKKNQLHPDTAQFFGSKFLGATEAQLRADAWKWENCLHASCRKQGRSIRNPCFDIHYVARLEGQAFTPNDKLNYAMVVTVQASSLADLYDQVVRKYAPIIRPLEPVLEIPVNISNSDVT